MNEVKNQIDKLQSEWNQFLPVLKTATDEQKQFGDRLGDTDAKLNAISDSMNQIEATVDAIEKRKTRANLEVKVGIDGVDLNSREYQTAVGEFKTWLRSGDKSAVSPESRKLLRVEDDETGGFGAPAEFVAEMIKGVVEVSPVRGSVRVRNTGNRSVRVMKRTGQFAAVWVSEIATRSETTGLTYGLEEIPTHEVYALVDVSNQDLEDNDFNLEGELRGEFAEQFALAEGTAVISGTGNGQPEGITVNAAVTTVNSGHASLMQYDTLVTLSHGLNIGHVANAQFYFSLPTLGDMRKLTNGSGDPLWAPMAADSPATILGFQYNLWQGIAGVSAAAVPVYFGDLKRAYMLVDRIGMELQRDPFTQNTSGATRFIARKRLGGQVVLAEAVRTYTISA